MNIIRSLLLKLEALQTGSVFRMASISGVSDEVALDDVTADEIDYHLALHRERGLIEPQEGGTMDGSIYFRRLTWDGHDFLDSVRGDDVWNKTRRGAEEVGGWTFDLLKDLAKGFLKKQIEQRTGVQL